MKKIITLAAVIGGAAILASCSAPMASGALYTNVTTGTSATSGSTAKMGQACNTSILGLVATGNASIASAKAQGGISRVASVDYKAKNILGLYGKYCVVVHGS